MVTFWTYAGESGTTLKVNLSMYTVVCSVSALSSRKFDQMTTLHAVVLDHLIAISNIHKINVVDFFLKLLKHMTL